MVIACIVFGAAAVLSTAALLLYRSQIKSINRQLNFLKNNQKSNLLITRDIPAKEINELIEILNNMRQQSVNNAISIEQKDDELKKMITSISHDIRTPLTSLSGYFELLKGENEADKIEEYETIIAEKITCLKEMLEQLFTYVKLQDNEYVLEKEEVDLKEHMYRALAGFYNQIHDKNIEPEINISDENMMTNGNAFSIDRIFQNVIKNALEHGISELGVGMSVEKEHICIDIYNDVDSQAQNNIDVFQVFTRFYKADNARSSTSTGLGLWIARELVERNGGKIQASCENGRFIIEIIF